MMSDGMCEEEILELGVRPRKRGEGTPRMPRIAKVKSRWERFASQGRRQASV